MDFPSLVPGLKAQAAQKVDETNTASSWVSGALDVYATPAMVALMEYAAAAAVQDLLPDGFSTVGTELCVKHLAASVPGGTVRAEAELTAAAGRRLEFEVAAFDEGGKIGEGTHSRFIVENGPFLAKAAARQQEKRTKKD
ncbi:MAG: thioesterase family protein [Treponema sp.]|jgi:predicted thioesterase|nr:thioesterase family protein [Treponema sp.]